jgi:hypothetical protein
MFKDTCALGLFLIEFGFAQYPFLLHHTNDRRVATCAPGLLLIEFGFVQYLDITASNHFMKSVC